MQKQGKPVTALVVKLIVKLEFDFCEWVDKAPKKFKYTILQQILFEFGRARQNTVDAMDLPKMYMDTKYRCLCEAHSAMRNVDILLTEFSDRMGMSGKQKGMFDIQIYDIYSNLSRLLNSFETKVNKESESPNFGAESEHHNYKDA